MERAEKIKSYIGVIVKRLLMVAGILIVVLFVLENVFKIDIAESSFYLVIFNIVAAGILLFIYMVLVFLCNNKNSIENSAFSG